MSDPPKADTLCERCSLLSFDDGAIGGQEVVGEDGVARLSFPESQIEVRPEDWQSIQALFGPPDFRLVRLNWKLNETLPDMPHLSYSSQLGCVFCQTLRKSLEETLAEKAKTKAADDGPLDLVAFLSLNQDGGIEGLVIEGTSKLAGSKDSIQIDFPIEAASGCCQWLRVQSERDVSYLDPTNVQKMHQLLDHCTSTCHPDTPSQFMPTRLIDIGHDVSAIPRLVLSSNIGHSQQMKYAALSYCWGSEKDAESQFKTEKASLKDRYTGLPGELMTSTTRDAIALARAIGLRYLWIDALCIIQDDEDDWSHQSSQMNLVYHHAFVTFCSLNSDLCHESFLNRAPAVRIPFQSTIRKAIKGSYLIRLRSRPYAFFDCGWYFWDSIISKWNNRCWTFQEKEMSTRLLLFGALRMHFICARSRWSEGDAAPRDRHQSTSGVSDMIARFKDKFISSRELYEYWGWLLVQYAPRSATFDKDRLPAIAGLARMIGEALQDQYLAGLWKRDLHHGLMWKSSGDMILRGLEAHIWDIRERNYVAPSWSWAVSPSVFVISRGSANMIEESVIVDVDTDTSSDDPYGQVSGGFFRIRGKMAQLPDRFPNHKETRWSNHWLHFSPTDTYNGYVFVVTDWLHRDKEAGLENLTVMLLYRIDNEDGAKALILRGLLLYPADELGTYYRVGVVESHGHEGYSEMRGWFEESQEETICII